MAYESLKLGDLCTVMTGAPLSRAKKLPEGGTGIAAKVLTPRSMDGGRIVDGEVACETISKVKDDLFTREGDVIVKASTPYDCVYVDEAHKGILVASFALIVRAKPGSGLDMRYLAAYLNQPQTRSALQGLSKGMTLQLIKQKDLDALEIPIVSAAQQVRLAALFENTQKRKAQCLLLMEKSDKLLEAEFSKTVFD